MQMPNNGLTKFLFAVEIVGAVFVGIFLTAYLGGLFVLPQTTVFHSVPAVRLALSVLGGVFLVLILATVVLVYIKRK